MNGMNILSRDWKKWDEIEYDEDAASKHQPGTHIHKGKILTVIDGAAGESKIIIKRTEGYYSLCLNDIKLKLLDNGKPIITYEGAHGGGVVYPTIEKRYKYMLGEHLLFTEWAIGQEIEYDTDVNDYENELTAPCYNGKSEGLQGDKIVIIN